MNNENLEAAVGTIFSALIIIIVLSFYFLPAIIAKGKDHPNKVAIFFCNLFFGMSGIGWLICLIWATTYKVKMPSIIEVQKLSK